MEEYIILIVVKNPLTMKREKQLTQQTLAVLKQLEREREREYTNVWEGRILPIECD